MSSAAFVKVFHLLVIGLQNNVIDQPGKVNMNIKFSVVKLDRQCQPGQV